MSQHHSLNNRQLEPRIERTIRLFLRAMGAMALVTCVIFWLSLLLR